jgi:hypothetical protein
MVKTIEAGRQASAQPKTISTGGKVKKPRSSAPRPSFSKILD